MNLRLSAGLTAMLLASVSTAAVAAPADAGAARLQAMQRQLDAMRAELEALRSGRDDPGLSAMQQQLDGMARELAELKAARASDEGEIATLRASAAKAPAATVGLPNGKPSIATADGRFTANLRAIMMLDAGRYFQDGDLPAGVVGRDLNSGTNFRRARLGIDGRLFGDFDYAFVYEFGGSGAEEGGRLYEASLTYTALKPWRIKVGAFEPNIGLAAAVSTSQMPLMERPSPAEIARSVAAGDSRVALQLTGNGAWGGQDGALGTRWLLSTALTGAAISSTQAFDEQTAWIGRIALAPYAGEAWQAHLGANLQYVIEPNDATGGGDGVRYPIRLRDRPELRLDGTRLIDTGAIDARHASVLGAEAAFAAGPFLLEGEYFRYRIDRRQPAGGGLPDPRFSGWYAQAAWVLTGERRPYNAGEARFDAPRPSANFDPAAGGWGALEVAARYSMVDLNFRAGAPGAAPAAGGVRGGEQEILTLGLNWYLNPTIRLMLDYQHVDIERLNAAGAPVGQSYDAVAARGQISF